MLARRTVSNPMTSSEHVHGLHILASGGSSPEAYIVAIHGLMGHLFKTWTHLDNTLWLRDSLPQVIPTVRVLTFSYNAEVFTKSKSDLEDIGSRLLAELEHKRGRGKPIIFICHSLGGIVFKKALIMAHEQDKRYGDVVKSTKGVVFLGVPHAGSTLAFWNTLLPLFRIVSVGTVPMKDELLGGLQNNSQEFTDITTSFRSRCADLSIKTFYETRKTAVLGVAATMVVEKRSAIVGVTEETAVALDEDHLSICKMKSGGESLVECTVIDLIRKTIRSGQGFNDDEAGKDKEPPEEDQKILGNLFLLSRAELLQNIPEPIEETCEWILRDETYRKWMTDKKPQSLLWVEGPPGFGKSVLARYILKDVEQWESDAAICPFFCNSTIDNRIRGAAIIRTILYELLPKNPRLMRYAKTAQMNRGPQWIDHLDALIDVFESCLNDPALIDIYIIVDALDECRDVQNSLQWITTLLRQSTTSTSKVRVIVTSRPNFSLLNELKNEAWIVRLDNTASQRASGLRRFVEAKAAAISDASLTSAIDRKWLVDQLIERSEGCFLWVSMIIKNLEKDAFLTKGLIEDAWNMPPSDMHAIYSRILKNFSFTSSSNFIRLKSCLVSTHHPLVETDPAFHAAVAIR